MRKKIFGLTLGTLLFALSVSAATAQQPGKIFRIGFLDGSTSSGREILKDAFPNLTRVGLLLPATASASPEPKELRAAASALMLKLEEISTQADAKGLESAFQTAKQKQVNAIMTMSTRGFFAERKRI